MAKVNFLDEMERLFADVPRIFANIEEAVKALGCYMTPGECPTMYAPDRVGISPGGGAQLYPGGHIVVAKFGEIEAIHEAIHHFFDSEMKEGEERSMCLELLVCASIANDKERRELFLFIGDVELGYGELRQSVVTGVKTVAAIWEDMLRWRDERWTTGLAFTQKTLDEFKVGAA